MMMMTKFCAENDSFVPLKYLHTHTERKKGLEINRAAAAAAAAALTATHSMLTCTITLMHFLSALKLHRNVNNFSLIPATIFLNFTLNSFSIFFILSVKTFTIFQLIEKLLRLLLSSLAIFTVCFTAESLYKAINECSMSLCFHFSHDVARNINQNIEVFTRGGTQC
jgi:hypothetical protein